MPPSSDIFGQRRLNTVGCGYCGSGSHEEKFCPKTATGQSNLMYRRCEYCGSKDHEYKDCPKCA